MKRGTNERTDAYNNFIVLQAEKQKQQKNTSKKPQRVSFAARVPSRACHLTLLSAFSVLLSPNINRTIYVCLS